jgi:hypothetical protein
LKDLIKKEIEMITRTTKEIEEMIAAIKEAKLALPEVNVFGDSNRGSKLEMEVDIRTLQSALDNPDVAHLSLNDEAYAWLIGKFSILEDYLPQKENNNE